MAYEKVARDAALARLAKRDEVRRVELEIWVKVKRPPMVDLELHLSAAYFTGRMFLEMRLSNSRPMRRPGMTERMLALGGIDEVFDDGHGRKRKKPH